MRAACLCFDAVSADGSPGLLHEKVRGAAERVVRILNHKAAQYNKCEDSPGHFSGPPETVVRTKPGLHWSSESSSCISDIV